MIPSIIWTILWYVGAAAGMYFLAAAVFMLTARLEKDKDGSLIIDPNSLHYRACYKCYEWRMYKIYNTKINDHVDINHVEYYQLGICSYFWRVLWSFILLPIGYTICFVGQAVKTIIYTPFMFLFGWYPWPTRESMKRCQNIFAVEVRHISFPRVWKLELKPYLVALPVLYGYAYRLSPDQTFFWSIIIFVVGITLAVLLAIQDAFYKVQASNNQKVVLVREYIKVVWRGVCPRLKVKTKS